MESSSLLSLTSVILLLSSTSSSSAAKLPPPPKITYHSGPILAGNVTLAFLWYGKTNIIHKSGLKDFVRALNGDKNVTFEPRVSDWWDMVESYQKQLPNHKFGSKIPDINVNVVRQVDDPDYSVGRTLADDDHTLETLVTKATAGLDNAVAVIFAAPDVTVLPSCSGTCFVHGTTGKQLYLVVGNPIEECPAKCAWPYHEREGAILVLKPPSGDVAKDAIIIHFAAGLASTITNPYHTGFYGDKLAAGNGEVLEVATACFGVFGKGAFPGYSGRVRIEPRSGVGFNAHGIGSNKYILPAVWNPVKSTCWTTLSFEG